MMRAVSWLVVVVALVLPPSACAQTGSTEELSIDIGPIQTAAATDGPGQIKEFTVAVRSQNEAEERRFLVQGPDKLIDRDEHPRAEKVGDRLLVTTRSVIAVFDLATGKKVIDQIAAPEVVYSDDGRRVAFRTLQSKFVPAEATSTVIQALDVPTLELAPVFPERTVIEPSQFGRLLAWIDKPADRHSAGPLFLSPDGTRLVFFCTHALGAPESPREVYLVVVDLSRGPAESTFSHTPFDWEMYLRPGVSTSDRSLYFVAESVTWQDEDVLHVTPPEYAHWLEDEIVIQLPGLRPSNAEETVERQRDDAGTTGTLQQE